MYNLMIFFDWIIISSVSASVLIGIILLVKLIVKDRQSPRWHYCIWFILMIRLMIPYVPHSSVSIFNLLSPLTNKISLESIESRIKISENVNLSNETKGNNVIRKGLNPINKIEKTNKKFISLLGFTKPIILIPQNILNTLNRKELSHIILHTDLERLFIGRFEDEAILCTDSHKSYIQFVPNLDVEIQQIKRGKLKNKNLLVQSHTSHTDTKLKDFRIREAIYV